MGIKQFLKVLNILLTGKLPVIIPETRFILFIDFYFLSQYVKLHSLVPRY